MGLDASEQLYELDPMTRAGGLCGRVVSSADFTLREPEAKPLAGSLQSEADVYLTTHANTLHLRAAPPLQRSPLPPRPYPDSGRGPSPSHQRQPQPSPSPSPSSSPSPSLSPAPSQVAGGRRRRAAWRELPGPPRRGAAAPSRLVDGARGRGGRGKAKATC